MVMLKLENCPVCGGKLDQIEYDDQWHRACGWEYGDTASINIVALRKELKAVKTQLAMSQRANAWLMQLVVSEREKAHEG